MREAALDNLTKWERRLVGFEFENPLILPDGNPATYEDMRRLWEEAKRAGWSVEHDGSNGAILGGTTELLGHRVTAGHDIGAGNFELALPPLPDISTSQQLLKAAHAELLPLFKQCGLSLAALGLQPGTPRANIQAYRYPWSLIETQLRRGIAREPNFGVGMMTSAHQANVSTKLAELIPVTNALAAVTGLIVALCGNSAVHDWQALPWKEWRVMAWRLRYAGCRGFEKLGGFPPRPFSSLADLWRYYWDVPRMPYPPKRGGDFVFLDSDTDHLTYFRSKRVFGKKEDGSAVELVPSVQDLNLAMVFCWPFAKPHVTLDPKRATVAECMEHLDQDTLEEYVEDKIVNCYVEYRGAAAAPKGEEAALPALILGLVEDHAALCAFASRFAWDDWRELVSAAAVRGMDCRIGGVPADELLRELIAISQNGLSCRGLGEEAYLAPLEKRVVKKRNPADEALQVLRNGKDALLTYARY